MNQKKFLTCFLVASMFVTAVPTVSFAKDTNLEAATELNGLVTTSSAISLINNDVTYKTYAAINNNLTIVNGQAQNKEFSAEFKEVDKGQVGLSYSVNYEWNDAWFFEDNTLFNPALAKTSMMLAQLAYYSSNIDLEVNEETASTYGYGLETEEGFLDIKGVMALHGLTDVREYNLRTSNDDNHVVQFNVGHKKVTKNGETKDIISVAIRGTRGEMEWLSNGDMGTSLEFENIKDWTEELNHKGFDITANRIVEVLSNYMKETGIKKDEATFWVTGHSRGGAVANLVGKKLEDMSFNTFTYTFATPNTTTAKEGVEEYKSIFNIVSKDDIVPAIPVEGWGFTKYGQTAEVVLDASGKAKWAEMTGKKYKAASVKSLQSTLNAFAGLAADRDELQSYNKGDKALTVTKTFTSDADRTAALASIPTILAPYYEVTTYETTLNGKTYYKYDMKQQPNYLVQAAVLNLAGTMSDMEFLALDVPSACLSAKTSLLTTALGGISHPHYVETYLLLTDADFSDYFEILEVKEEQTEVEVPREVLNASSYETVPVRVNGQEGNKILAVLEKNGHDVSLKGEATFEVYAYAYQTGSNVKVGAQVIYTNQNGERVSEWFDQVEQFGSKEAFESYEDYAVTVDDISFEMKDQNRSDLRVRVTLSGMNSQFSRATSQHVMLG